MQATIKQLSEKLHVETVYVGGFVHTLIMLGKARVFGKVERPAGTKGKAAIIYEIDDKIFE